MVTEVREDALVVQSIGRWQAFPEHDRRKANM